jgi:hypothetical protein
MDGSWHLLHISLGELTCPEVDGGAEDSGRSADSSPSELDPADFFATISEAAAEGASADECSQCHENQRPATSRAFAGARKSETSAYDKFRARSGCELVFCQETQRHVMLLPGAKPKPSGFCLGSALYQKRLSAAAKPFPFATGGCFQQQQQGQQGQLQQRLTVLTLAA